MRYFRVKTVSTALRIRQGASTSSAILGTMDKGAEFVVETETSQDVYQSGYHWVKVNIGEQVGYVAREYLVQIDEKGNVIKDYTNDRVDNTTNDKTDSTEETDQKVVVKEESSKGWLIAGGITLAVGALMNIFL